MPAGSMSASTPTPPPSRSRASAAGGSSSGRPLPRRQAAADHRRLRRQQRCPGAPVEARTAALRRRTGLAITVAHLPPGTSKWNRIEHRLFAFITQNWRGKPLVSHQVIVQLIGATTTKTGLTVACELDAEPLSQGHQGLRCRDGRAQHRARRVPRRVELHHLTHPSIHHEAVISRHDLTFSRGPPDGGRSDRHR